MSPGHTAGGAILRVGSITVSECAKVSSQRRPVCLPRYCTQSPALGTKGCPTQSEGMPRRQVLFSWGFLVQILGSLQVTSRPGWDSGEVSHFKMHLDWDNGGNSRDAWTSQTHSRGGASGVLFCIVQFSLCQLLRSTQVSVPSSLWSGSGPNSHSGPSSRITTFFLLLLLLARSFPSRPGGGKLVGLGRFAHQPPGPCLH